MNFVVFLHRENSTTRSPYTMRGNNYVFLRIKKSVDIYSSGFAKAAHIFNLKKKNILAHFHGFPLLYVSLFR